jgi:type IV pilus assembly protein PilM
MILTGVDSSRKKISAKAIVPLNAGKVVGSVSERNLIDDQAVRGILKEELAKVAFGGSEISVVIPDDAARIAFVNAENLPAGHDEREAFIRWKLKKNLPFDVDSAQIAFRVLAPPDGSKNGKGADLMVVLSPRAVVEEYENLMQSLDLHAGFVMPSTVAALNLSPAAKDDAVVVKVAPGCITTTVFQRGNPRFYRRVAEMPLHDAVYPTILYYQDKLGGGALTTVAVCGYDRDIRFDVADLQKKLDAPVHRLGPDGIEDIYKPALGAVNYVWADLA